MDRYIKSIKESAKAQNVTEILMPGEPEYRTASERLKQGIPLAATTLQELAVLSESLGISLSLMD
jgi:LDH2 family malate/lactate/ureidoglycolate dehydrogenase